MAFDSSLALFAEMKQYKLTELEWKKVAQFVVILQVCFS